MKVIQPSMAFCETLTDLPLFASLNAQQRLALLSCAEIVLCEKGELFFRQGEKADRFLLLKSGRVKMRRLNPNGNEVVLHLSAPPQMIGCKGLTLPGSSYPADAVAVDTTVALRFGRNLFLDVVGEMPDVFFGLLIDMNRRLSDVFALQTSLRESVDSRIANLLLNQAFPEDANWDDWRNYKIKRVRLTKSLMAAIVGTTTETAIRVLSRWRKRGLIRTLRGCTEILEPQSIIDIAMLKSPSAVEQPI